MHAVPALDVEKIVVDLFVEPELLEVLQPVPHREEVPQAVLRRDRRPFRKERLRVREKVLVHVLTVEPAASLCRRQRHPEEVE